MQACERRLVYQRNSVRCAHVCTCLHCSSLAFCFLWPGSHWSCLFCFSSLFIVLFSFFFSPCLSLSQTHIHAYVGKIKASARVGHLKGYTQGQYTRSLIVLFINDCFSCASKRRAPTLVKRARWKVNWQVLFPSSYERLHKQVKRKKSRTSFFFFCSSLSFLFVCFLAT